MILRHLHPVPPDTIPVAGRTRPAARVFFESQKDVPVPYGIVLQIAHSRLAGELAGKLLPGIFGPLPSEVIEAAWKHDFGWAGSDEQQIRHLPQERPKPFPEASDDELTSWRRSLKLANRDRPLTQVLISRHFHHLTSPARPSHDAYRKEESEHRAELEKSLPSSEEDLRRGQALWASAIYSRSICAQESVSRSPCRWRTPPPRMRTVRLT